MTQSELEQFCLLAEKQKGLACVALIKEVLKHNKIYLFGELFKIHSINQLKSSPEFFNAYNTLELFAFGTYSDYNNNKSCYIELTDIQIHKLKILSLISLTFNQKQIPYSQIQSELDIHEICILENLVIEAIYKKLIVGKLDERNKCLRFTDSISRDVPSSSLPDILEKLIAWKNNCGHLLDEIEQSSCLLKESRIGNQKEQIDVQTRTEQLKLSLKDKSNKDDDMDKVGKLKSRHHTYHTQKSRNRRGKTGSKHYAYGDSDHPHVMDTAEQHSHSSEDEDYDEYEAREGDSDDDNDDDDDVYPIMSSEQQTTPAAATIEIGDEAFLVSGSAASRGLVRGHGSSSDSDSRSNMGNLQTLVVSNRSAKRIKAVAATGSSASSSSSSSSDSKSNSFTSP